MASFIGLIRPSSRDDDPAEVLAGLPGLRRSHLGLDLLGSTGGRGLLWHADAFGERPVVEAALVREGIDADLVEITRLIGSNISDPEIGTCILRTLLVTVEPGVDWPTVERFERDLSRMPDHIPGIVNWRLSRVRGRGLWTHAWEQEYRYVEDLRVDYMASPYHWGWVDRWFDPEHPRVIVAPALAHVFCAATGSVLAPPVERQPLRAVSPAR